MPYITLTLYTITYSTLTLYTITYITQTLYTITYSSLTLYTITYMTRETVPSQISDMGEKTLSVLAHSFLHP